MPARLTRLEDGHTALEVNHEHRVDTPESRDLSLEDLDLKDGLSISAVDDLQVSVSL
jgi:hypothetical protein